MNHYEVLGIKKTATTSEIKEAYKELVKKYHPDIYPGDKSYAEKRTKEINIAYDVLSDPKAKEEYDLSITPQLKSSADTSTSKTSGGYSYTTKEHSTPKTTYVRPDIVKNSEYSYENYKKNFKTTTSYYDPSRRYTDYHRSKVPNSNYSTKTTMNDDSSSKMFDSFDNMNVQGKLALFLFAIVLYIIFSLVSFYQVTPMIKNPPSVKPSTSTNTTVNGNFIEDPNNKYNFDIYDYFTKEELYKLYTDSFSDAYPTYNEFIDDLSEIMIETYY